MRKRAEEEWFWYKLIVLKDHRDVTSDWATLIARTVPLAQSRRGLDELAEWSKALLWRDNKQTPIRALGNLGCLDRFGVLFWCKFTPRRNSFTRSARGIKLIWGIRCYSWNNLSLGWVYVTLEVKQKAYHSEGQGFESCQVQGYFSFLPYQVL